MGQLTFEFEGMTFNTPETAEAALKTAARWRINESEWAKDGFPPEARWCEKVATKFEELARELQSKE